MQYLLTAEQMKTADTYTSEVIGIPSIVLMERAALGVAERVKDLFQPGAYVGVVAGKGNNGADALAAGRILMDQGYHVIFYVYDDTPPEGTNMAIQQKILASYGADLRLFDEIDFDRERFDVIIDGLFGIGLSRDIEGLYRNTILLINEKRERELTYVISVDIASGIHSDTGEICGFAVRADDTVTFGFGKRGMYLYPGCEYSGNILLCDIGITNRSIRPLLSERVEDSRERLYFTYDTERADDLLGHRSPTGHKGTFGKALIIAGSRNMSGACTMAASACMRMGTGMVKIFTEEANRVILQETVPAAMLSTWEEGETKAGARQLIKDLTWCDTCAIGPGLGKGVVQRALVKTLLEVLGTETEAENTKVPEHLVIDADAIRIIAEDGLYDLLEKAGRNTDIIFTPHLAECAALLGTSMDDLCVDKDSKIKQFADRYHVTILCKDARTLIATWMSGRIYLNTSGNDGLATAGSGDVLAGMITACTAQGMSAMEAAAAGSYLHGRYAEAAEVVTERRGLVAPDLYTLINAD